MLNFICLQGRLVREPELKQTNNGTSVASFTIAVDRDYQSGGSEKQTDFIDCTAWRQTAEFVCKYFHKGQLALVTGALQSRKWQDKQGNNRVSWEVTADKVHFCGDKKDNTGYVPAAVNVSAAEFIDLPDDDNGELPF